MQNHHLLVDNKLLISMLIQNRSAIIEPHLNSLVLEIKLFSRHELKIA